MKTEYNIFNSLSCHRIQLKFLLFFHVIAICTSVLTSINSFSVMEHWNRAREYCGTFMFCKQENFHNVKNQTLIKLNSYLKDEFSSIIVEEKQTH